MARGKFYALEGGDGAGSSTQVKLLSDYLQSLGRNVHVTAEPSSGAIGKNIREFLGGDIRDLDFSSHILALTFAADRLHHYESEILPQIEKGVDVVTDRYTLSSLVYQGKDLNEGWVKTLNQFAPRADFTILIDVPAEIACERSNNRGGKKEIFDDLSIQEQIRSRYLKFVPEFDGIVVDGSSSPEEVFNQIMPHIPR